jgi:uncharacterized repeat protein (TIGR01451 family)
MARSIHTALARLSRTGYFAAWLLIATLAVFAGSSKAQAQDIDWIINLNDLGSDPTPGGGVVTYNATIGNAGSDPAPANTYTLAIPAGTTLESVTGFTGCPATPIVGPATPTCTLPPLLPDAAIVGTFSLRTPTLGSVNFGVNVGTAGDVLPGNNGAVETTTITAGANLQQTVTGPTSAVAGSTVSYTLTTTNLGPSTASGMVVSFPIPTGLGAIVPPAGCTLSGSTYQCAVPTPILVGGTHNFTFQAQIQSAAGSTITPLASVTAGTPPDPVAGNNTGTLNTTVTAGSDLYITKTRSPVAGILVGDTVTFTLTPRYTGDNPTSLTVTDAVPARYTPVSASGSGWSCTITGQNLSCTRPAGTGPGNDVALPAITLVTTAASAGTATNTATVGAAGPVDPNLGNNSATDGGATVANPTVDLRANKSGPNPPLVVVGNSTTFRLSATNIGSAGFFGTLVLTDSLPAGYTATAATGSGWTCSPAMPVVGPANITCQRVYTTGARLAAGATTPDVLLTATVTATGARTNTLNVSSPDGNLPDLNGPNDTTGVTTTGQTGPNAADVSITKSAGVPSVVSGDVQTFSLEIRNSGPATATTVAIVDDLTGLINNGVGPTGSGYIGHTITPGLATGLVCTTSSLSSTSRRLACTAASLPICSPGVDCPRIDVQVRPGGNPGSRDNTATAFSQDIADPVLTDNTATVSYNVTARTDVDVTKIGSPDPATAGQNLTYVVTARALANGLSQAENVSIVDTLPPNVTYVSASPSAGVCSVQPTPGSTTTLGSTVECNLGTIANGAQRTVTIVVRPNTNTRGTTITNAVTVSTTTPETDTGNNNASVDINVQNPILNLLVNKVDSVDPLAIGDDTVYTIIARNNGPSTGENVTVTDTLPAARVRYRSHTIANGGTCSTVPAVDAIGGTLVCSWPSVPAGEQRTLTVTMRGDTKGVATNVVTVSSDETLAGFESDSSNNTAVQTTTVRTRADMQVVSKIPSINPANLRETFTYTIRLRNNTGVGLAEADEVFVNDTLPTGMQLTGTPTINVVSGSASIQTCTGTGGSTSFTCSLGTVTSGAVVDITAPVQIVSVTSYPQTFTNTASVVTSSLDVAPGNNSNDSSMTINSSSIAGRLFRDFDNDTTIDATDTGIAGITMTLTGTAFDGASITRTATTDANGNYTFALIPQGTYAVAVGTIAEQHLTNGTGTLGSAGGTLANPSSTTGIALPANTAATGYLFARVPTARLGLAKNVQGGITVLADGSVRLTLRHTLRNFSLEPLINVAVTDVLAGATPNRFGTYTNPATPATDPLAAGTYTVYNRSTTCGTGLNNAFNGSSDTTLLSGNTRPVGSASCTIDFILRYQPPTPLPTPAAGNRWENQSTMTGEGQWSGQTSATNPQLNDPSDSGTNPDSNSNGLGNETVDNTPTPVAPTLTPTIRLVKTGDTSGLSNPVVAGNTIPYSFVVSNPGTMALTNVTVNDPLLGGAVPGSPIALLAPGQSTTLTGVYTLTATDLANRQVTNQATATGTHTLNSSNVPQTVSDLSGTATSNDTATVVSLGDIRLIKTVDTSGLSNPVAVGNTLTYRFEIRNTGSSTLTNVTVTDPLPGLVLNGNPIASMAPGAVDTTSITGTYTITQADIDLGRITNSAVVSGRYGTDGLGNPLLVTDTSGTNATNDTPLVTPVAQTPTIALVKTVDTSALSTPPAVGDTLTYAFTVTNTGNTTLTNVTLADPLPGMVLTAPAIPSLAPGASASVWTGTYALTQANIDAGFVQNQATATGRYTNPVTGVQTVTDPSGTTALNNTPTRANNLQTPSVALIKTVNTAGLSSPPAVGDTLTYAFTVTNTGNTTLTNVTLADPLPGMVLTAPAIPSLAPGASSSVWTGTYALTQANIDAGFVQNQATATGRYTDPATGVQTVTDPSGTTALNNTPTRANNLQAPDVALVKTIDTSALSTPPQVGDTLTYGFTVTNTGNTTLTNVTLADPLPGMALTAPAIPSLAPGASASTWTGSYDLTQADIDAGVVENQATATGSYVDPVTGPQTVEDLSGTTTANDTPTSSGDLQSPSVALVKTVDTSGLSFPAAVGDTLTYTFTVRNTGNTTLTNVTLADPLPGMTLTAPAIATLAPGASDNTSWTGSYDLTQADIDAGVVENQATATGSYVDPVTGPETVEDLSGTTTANDTPTSTGNLQSPSVALTKTVDTSGVSSPSAVGDTLVYAFTVTNTGNTTLTNVTLADPLPGMVLTAPAIPSLAPGASSSIWTGSYELIQSDIDAGFVENQATATGSYTDPVTGPQTVDDLSGATTGDDDTTTAPIPQDPSIALVKTVDTSGLSSPAAVGDTLAYAFTVTNTGNTTLTNVTLADPLPGMALTAPAIATLAPGASISTWTGSYNLTQADIDNGFVENQATATGSYTDPVTGSQTVDDLSGATTGDDDTTTAPIPQDPSIALVKTVDTSGVSSPAAVGDTLTYGFTVTNTGNTTLTNVTLADPLPGMVLTAPTIATLAPGASISTWTGSYNLTQADIDNGFVENQATATGGYTDPVTGPQTVEDLSGATTGDDDTTTAGNLQSPSVALVKTVDASGLSSPVAVGDTLTYAFTVTNTGNTTLTNVTLADPLPGMVLTAPAIATLAPGASSATWTGTYDITQADIDAGFVENQATATGSYTDPITGPQTVDDLSGTTATNDTPTLVGNLQSPSIALVKTVDASGLSSPVAVGDTLTYAFTVTNTGNTTLTDVSLADPLPGMDLTAPDIASLAPGASSAVWTGSYDLTQADIDAGFVENQATATGTYTDPITGAETVDDLSGATTGDDDPTSATFVQNPAVALVKTVDTSSLSSPVAVGDTLAYSFVVTNTGNTTLTNVTLADPLPGMVLTAPAIPSLAPGASSSIWTGSYDLTQADIDAGFVENQATATGGYVDPITGPETVDDLSGTTTADDDTTTAAIPQEPSIALIKTSDASGLSNPAQVGETIQYGFAVTNTGNTTLTNVTLTDPLPGMALNAPAIPSLAPGATSTVWTGSYDLIQADIDNGFVENQATATGSYTDPITGPQTVEDPSGTTNTNDVPTRTDLAQGGSIALTKTADVSGLSTPAQIGETITYTFEVRNTGNVTLTNVVLDDPLPGMALNAPAIPSLAPGATVSTWTGSYDLNQADIDNGFVENQATATGTYTDGLGQPQDTTDLSGTTFVDNTPTTAPVAQNPAVALIKTVDASGLSSPVAVGDTLTYGFTVTNTGNTTLTNVTLADPLPGMALTAPAIPSLAPGASVSTWTGTYNLTQADIDNGFVENQATATGSYVDPVTGPQTVDDLSGATTGDDDTTTAPIPQDPSIALVKTVDTSGLSSPAAVGDTLTYGFTVTNTGNTTLTNVTLADPLPGMTLNAPAIATLAPGASISTWTGSYDLIQADIDNGFVENQATATGSYTDPVAGPQTVDDLSGTTTGDDTPTQAPLGQNAAIALIKTVDVSGLSSPVAVGDTLTYAFTVTNTGNTTLTNVTLADPLPGMTLNAPAIATLAPGASDNTSWTGSYELTQADIDNGFVENQATATGSYVDPVTGPQTVDDLSGATTGDDDTTTAAIPQDPSIALVKTVDTSGLSSPAAVSDTLAYAFTVTNTGNTTLTNVTLADPLPGMVLTAPSIPSLAPGASASVWTGSYDLIQADIDNGFVENQATATGSYTDPVTGPQTVEDLSGTTTGDDDTTTAGIPQTPALSLVKTVDTSALSSPVAVGDTLTYAFTVTNTGNTTLTNVTLADPLPGMALTAPAIPSLAPGASASMWTGSYDLTQADIDAGFVENQATATGSYVDPVTGPQTVDDLSGTTTANDTPTSAGNLQSPSVALVKTVDTSGVSSPAAVGDTLTYGFTVTNTGNTTLTNVTLADPLPGMALTAPAIATLAPGASISTWTGSYNLTQADIDNGFVENQATATGGYTDPVTGPETVEDLSGTTTGDDTPTQAPLGQNAAIALVKTVDTAGLSSPVELGDTLTYAFTVTNTGNTTLTNVTLADPLPGMVLTAPAIASLAPGASASTWTGTYNLTQADIDNGFVENQATATGSYVDPIAGPQTVDDLSGATTSDDDTTTAGIPQDPSIALVKTVDTSGLSSPVAVGDALGYAFTVTNTGNTTLTNVTLADPLPGMALTAPTIATLAPGASASTWTGSYQLTQADIDAGFVENQATATGSYVDPVTGPQTVDDLSGTTTGNDDPTTATFAQTPAVALIKTVDTSALSSPVAVGDTLTYAFTVTNTGNTTLTNVTLTDPLPGMALTAPTIGTLAPGASASTWTGTYNLTQADIDAGFVENQATATGSYVDPVTGPQTVDDLSGTTATNNEPTVAPLGQTAAIGLVKTVDTSAVSAPAAVGDTLTYAFTVTNIGNTTLTNVTLADPLPGMVLTAPTIATLAPGASASTWTGSYQLTQADIDAGFVENQATATGSYVDPVTGPQTVDDLSGTTTGDDTPTLANLGQQGAISLVKTADTSGLSSPAQVGDTINYGFTVTNTGNTTLTNVTLADPMVGIVLDAPAIASLVPGATSSTWTGSYAITQADIDAGFVDNQATATGSYVDPITGPQTVEDLSGTDGTLDDTTRVALGQDASIRLVKRAFVDRPGGISEVGDTIRYTFEIQNTGNVTLETVTLADTLPGIAISGGPILNLEPGAIDTDTYTAVYAVTAQDFVNAEVINQATATGTYTTTTGDDAAVSAVSGTDDTNTDPTVVSIGLPAIDLDIDVDSIEDTNGNGRTDVGDRIVYTFTVTNTGNVPLTDVSVVPASLTLDMPNLSCAPIDLAVGGTAVLVCTGNAYTITPNDAATGSVVLEGDAEGTSPGGTVVNASSAAVSVTVSPAPVDEPVLLATKTANMDRVRVGDVVEWTVTIAHDQPGGVPVDVAVVDELPQGLAYQEGSARLNGVRVDVTIANGRVIFPEANLVPGATLTATLRTAVLSSAQDRVLTNRAWAAGGGVRLSNTAEASVETIQEAVFACGTVVGRVFVDTNHDGAFNATGDEGETGLAGVRLIAPNGVSVTTDSFGRYNLPCEALPSNIGSNFQLKLDTRSLPTGFSVTTENPRVVRLTAGMLTRLDFGVNAARPVQVDLDARAFPNGEPRTELRQALAGLANEITTTPSVVRIVYSLSPGETERAARNNLRAAERALRAQWNGAYALRVETRIVR